MMHETHTQPTPDLSRTLVKRPTTAPRETACPCYRGALAFGAALLLLNVIQRPHYRPWSIPGPAPTALAAGQSVPNLVGTWIGHFGDHHRPALLEVTASKTDELGNRLFEGVLLSRTHEGSYKIHVDGTVTAFSYHSIGDSHPVDGWSVKLDEGQTLSHPFLGYWARGVDYGYASATGLNMSGQGSDTAGNTYDWDFHHVSSTPVLPAD